MMSEPAKDQKPISGELTEEEALLLAAENERIRDKYGYCNSDLIVREGRLVGNAWHRYLQWDNKAAGSEYRKIQVRTYMGQIRVIVQDVSLPAYRSSVHIVDVKGKPTKVHDYIPILKLVKAEDSRETLERNLVNWLLSRREEAVLYGGDSVKAKAFVKALDAWAVEVL